MAATGADYTVVLTMRGYARFLQAVAAAESRVRARGDDTAAKQIRAAYNQYERELHEIGRDIAKLAERHIKREERTSRVRPDTGGDGGPRLNPPLGHSRAIRQLPGSVGVNDENVLRAAGVDWWWTNEFGYSGHIGRVVHGFFYDVGFKGRSRPGAAPSRSHPLFRPEGFQRGGGYRQLTTAGEAFHKRQKRQAKGRRPGMLISEPIPDRRFVQRGYLLAEREWHKRVELARQRFLRAIAGV